MKSDQIERVERVLAALADVSTELRPNAVEALCGDDDDVSLEVYRRLESGDDGRLLTRLRIALQDQPSAAGIDFRSMPRLPDVASPSPRTIGVYRIVRRIGAGGMGEVFLAEVDQPVRRSVALKVVRPGYDTDEVLTRFEAERQTLARLDHPNIARLLDAGTTDTGRPFFAMEYVPGIPITHFADQQKLDLRQRLELFTEVCHAVAHAHTKAVIHRDLKPSNVLAWLEESHSTFHGTRSPARVKVIDFGIAKVLEASQERAPVTRIGSLVGTYEYMSPEQASGSDEIDTRGDVYSLGVLLYELIAGLKPFERSEMSRVAEDEIRRMIREVEAPRPSVKLISRSGEVALTIARARSTEPEQLVRALRRELEWIPLRALRKERSRRYASVQELAADVGNYLEGRALIAGPESRAYRARKFVTRHRVAVTLAGLMVLMLVMGVIGTTLGMVEARRQRASAEASEREARMGAYRTLIFAAESAVNASDGGRARAALDLAEPELRGWEWDYLARVSVDAVANVPVANMGKHLRPVPLADSRHVWALPDNGTEALLIRIPDGRIVRRESAQSAAVHPRAGLAVFVRRDGALELTPAFAASPLWRLEAPAGKAWRIGPHSFSDDGRSLVVADHQGVLHRIDPASGSIIDRLGHAEPARSLVGYMPTAHGNAESIWYQSEVGYIRSFEPESGQDSLPMPGEVLVDRRSTYGHHRQTLTWVAGPVSFEARGEHRATTSLMVVPEGTDWLVSGHVNGSIRLRRIDRPDEVFATYVAGASGVGLVAVTPDHRYLLATLGDQSLAIVPVAARGGGQVDTSNANGAVVSRDRTRMLGLYWGFIQCVDTATGMPLWGANPGPFHVLAADFSADGSLVAVVGQGPDAELFVYDAATGRQLAAMSVSPTIPDPDRPTAPAPWGGNVSAIRFSEDGSTLWVSRPDGELFAVSTADWSRTSLGAPPLDDGVNYEGHEHDRGGRGILITPDGRYLLHMAHVPLEHDPSASRALRQRGILLVRDARTLALLARIDPSPVADLESMAISPDGRSLALGYRVHRGTAVVRLLSLHDFSQLWLTDVTGLENVLTLSFDQSGSRIAAAGSDNRLRLLDASSGALVFVTDLSAGWSYGVTFTPDDSLAVASVPTVSFFDRHAGVPLPEIVRQLWPATLPLPESAQAARVTIARAMKHVNRGNATPEPGLDALATIASTVSDEADRTLALSIASRLPPALNSLNSAALFTFLKADATPDELARAEAQARVAVSMKPQSSNLQANYGALLYRMGKFDQARAALAENVRLVTARNEPPAPMVLLRLALAEHHAGAPDAPMRYREAMRSIESLETLEPDLRLLIDEARGVFGF
jgi:serine/threonine protein kinase/WD40 repeat protein